MSYDSITQKEHNLYSAHLEPRPPPPPSPQIGGDILVSSPPYGAEEDMPTTAPIEVIDDAVLDGLLSGGNDRKSPRWTSKFSTKINSFLEFMVPSGGLTASIFELLSATLGAGSMALPFCYRETGLFLATALVFVGAISAFYSIHLLAVVSAITGQKTYEELVNHVFGKHVEIILDVAIIIFTYGSTIAYIIVIGDTLPALSMLVGVDPDVIFAQRWFLMTLATVVLVFPLSLLKHLSSLRFTAILGFGATLYLIGAMFFRVTEKVVVEHGLDMDEVALFRLDTNLFVAAPVVFYAFSSHVNIFSITKELRDPTPQRVDTVIIGNVVLATLVYGIIGLCGYLTFLDATADNVINNYDTYDVPIQLGSFLLTVAVILNIPLNTHPLRITFDWMVFGPESRIPENLRYYAEIFLMVFSALAIAILVPSITVVFSLLGATATSFCCYVMPGLLYLRVTPHPWYRYQNWAALLLIVAGTVSGITSTVIIIIDLVKDV